jgi:hypothetical protein
MTTTPSSASRRTLVLFVALALAITLVVLQAFGVGRTPEGRGAGAAFAVSSARDFVVRGDLATPLRPGGSAAIDIRIDNPFDTPLTVTALTGRVSTVYDAEGCTPADFTVSPLLGRVTVPADTSTSLAALGLPEAQWPRLAMADTAVEQDDCVDADLALLYSADGTVR